MKTLLLSTFLFACFIVSAQNYRLIPNGVNCYINDTGYVRGIRLDSGVVAGADSLYYNFSRVVEDTSCIKHSCGIPELNIGYSITGVSWVGKYYGVGSNGMQYFLDTLLSDTILFLTLAQVNDSWKMYAYPNREYLEARVTAINYDTVLGVMDSVKYIGISRLDSNAQPIAGAFSNKQFRLSKQHGLLDVINFQSILVDTALCHITGIRPLTRRQVYDFNVGDIIQISEHNYTYPGFDSGPLVTTRRCLSKILTSATSIRYQFENRRCNLISFYCYTDTVTEDYTGIDSLVYIGLPEEGTVMNTLNEYELFNTPNRYNGRTFMSNDHWWYTIEDSTVGKCHYRFCAFDINPFKSILVAGLGAVIFYDAEVGGTFTADFTYYKKGTEEWGTFFTGIDDIAANSFHAYISPNPAGNKVDFHLANVTASVVLIEITDLAGRILITQESSSASTVSINTSSLPNGLYLYHVKCAGNDAVGKLVIAR